MLTAQSNDRYSRQAEQVIVAQSYQLDAKLREILRRRAERPLSALPRAFLKWAGSKRLLLCRLLEILPHQFSTYFEPFLGSGSLFFLLRPPSALLSDRCVPLVETFRAVRGSVSEVIRHLLPMRPDPSVYYKIRAAPSHGIYKRAAEFIYLNKTCWNGLYRVNSAGQFNVPYGRPKSDFVCDSVNLRACSRPTLLCRRHQTWLVADVVSRVELDRLQEWVAYAKSSGRDFHVALCTPRIESVSLDEQERLRNNGIGWYALSANGFSEKIPTIDLALNVQLPQIKTLPRKAKTALGPAYEQFSRSMWREGFLIACQALEAEARKYLKRHRNRIWLVRSKGPPARINVGRLDRMTMGRLAVVFGRIQNKNRDDVKIGKALKAVIAERNAVVHHRVTAKSERKLRANVPRHMWCIVDVMRVVVL